MQYKYSANLYEYDVYQFKGLHVMERQNNKEKKKNLKYIPISQMRVETRR